MFAARTLVARGKNVALRQAPPQAGRTSDLIVDGVLYDVYTLTTGNVSRIASAIAKKGDQVKGGGVVLDLTSSPLSASQLGNILERVRGITDQISDIIVLGG